MSEEFSRLELIIGKDALNKLAKSKVAVFGIGGVGGYTVEALVRSGIGELDLIDNDVVAKSNLNRQIVATMNTIGLPKIEAAKNRLLQINPNLKLNLHKVFYTPETKNQFDFSKYDYVIDAIDTVVGKISIIEEAKKAHVPVISSMGAGNKMHPEMLEIADISKTSVCPLARVIRTELKKRKIKGVKVVFSKEIPIKPAQNSSEKIPQGKHRIPGSTAFVPPAAGLIIASQVVNDLISR